MYIQIMDMQSLKILFNYFPNNSDNISIFFQLLIFIVFYNFTVQPITGNLKMNVLPPRVEENYLQGFSTIYQCRSN